MPDCFCPVRKKTSLLDYRSGIAWWRKIGENRCCSNAGTEVFCFISVWFIFFFFTEKGKKTSAPFLFSLIKKQKHPNERISCIVIPFTRWHWGDLGCCCGQKKLRSHLDPVQEPFIGGSKGFICLTEIHLQPQFAFTQPLNHRWVPPRGWAPKTGWEYQKWKGTRWGNGRDKQTRARPQGSDTGSLWQLWAFRSASHWKAPMCRGGERGRSRDRAAFPPIHFNNTHYKRRTWMDGFVSFTWVSL